MVTAYSELFNSDLLLFILIDTNGEDITIGDKPLYLTEILIGQGNFGKFFKAELRGIRGNTPVVVKMLKGKSKITHSEDR